MKIMLESISVVPVESIGSADPDKARLIFCDAVGDIAAESFFCGDVVKLQLWKILSNA